MSIDTVFQPKGPTFGLTNSAVQIIPAGTGPLGMVSFRIQCVGSSAQRLGWGTSASGTASTAPAAGATANSISLAGGAVITLELPASTFFISSAAYVAGTSGFEVTPGQGFTST